MIDFKKEAQQEQKYLVSLRRDFHKHPELAFKEFATATRIEEELESFGISHSRVGETGVLGILKGAKAQGSVIALRADIDALPIQETHKAEYASTIPGVMHACGHDAHTASLLGAAKILAAHRADLAGEIRFIFQPAEEIGQGAKTFISAGSLTGVEKIFGLHTAYDLPLGSIGLKVGINNAAVDHFTIEIHGKSAHVATPELGIDALYIASQLVVGLQALVTRCTTPLAPVVVGVGKFSAGTAYNAVAEMAVLEGTTRTVSQEERYRLRELIAQAARNIAATYGGTADITWTDYASPLINNTQITREASQIVQELGYRIVTDRAMSLNGDDFAEYLLTIPGAYAYIGSANPSLPNTLISNHNGEFDIDEDALIVGAALYAAYAFSALSHM